MGEVGLVGIAAVGPHPRYVVTDGMAPLFDPPVIGIGGCVGRMNHAGRWVGEEAGNIVVGRRPVGLEGEQVVPAPPHDSFGDAGLRAHGVDGDKSTGQLKAFEQERDGGDLVGLVGGRLLAEHQTLARRPGRHEVERPTPPRPVVAAARRLTVDGDDVGLPVAQRLHPFGKAALEQLRIDAVHHVIERVVGRDAPLEGQEAAQKLQPRLAPKLDLDEVVHAAQRSAQHHKQDLPQRI